ncbi:hypothetical protein [Flavitalea sp.]|nr:hypothetical protein [Flavitalea sp.]
MSKHITSYEDMMQEKQRLEALLVAQKELIELDLQGLKSDLKPATNVISFIGSFKKKTASNPLLGIAVGLSTDILMRKLLFKRAGWAVKTVLPFLMRRVTRNLVSNPAKPGLLGKMVKRFS